MKLFAILRRRTALSLVTVLGVLLLIGSAALNSYQSSQVAYYNQGVELYKAGQVDQALQAFDKSLDAYRQAQHAGWLERHLLPGPSAELAALANGKKGNLFVTKQKPELAVTAYKESLKLNPGDAYQGKQQTAETNRLNEEALVVKFDLDLLFRKNPALAQQEGKRTGQQNDQSGDKPASGNNPQGKP
jgi:tetratricopeptide (TPR) repeat protein